MTRQPISQAIDCPKMSVGRKPGGLMLFRMMKSLLFGTAPIREVRRHDWTFTWPEDLLANKIEGSVREFASWLVEHGHGDGITRRVLLSRYWEFCVTNDYRPVVPWSRFDRSLKGAGIQRVRLSSPGRPYAYRVRVTPVLVLKTVKSRAASTKSREAA